MGTSIPIPRKSTPDEFTRYFVNRAIDKYDSEGLDATLAYYNTSESMDGQWYVFIMSEDDIMLAHAANPDLVNRSISAAIGPNGYPAGEAVAAVADDDGDMVRLHLSQSCFRRSGDQALLDGASQRNRLRLWMA